MHPTSVYQMVLKDSLSQQMPNVYVNEHFTTETPPGFLTNYDTGYYWTTTDGGTKNPSGYVDYDYLGWTFGYFPSPWNLLQDYDFNHIYYAGTQSANGPWDYVGTKYGIACGYFMIQFKYKYPTPTSSAAKQ